MSFSFHSNKVALAVATLATGLGLQFAAVAQTAGTLDITGQVTATTCSLNMTAGGNTVNNGSRTVSLGTVASTVAAANTLIGTKTIVKFDLKDYQWQLNFHFVHFDLLDTRYQLNSNLEAKLQLEFQLLYHLNLG